MARPRKPSHLHVVEGTARKSRMNKNEPKLATKRPKMPSGMSAKAKKTFGDVCDLLEQMGILTIADGMALELLCEAYAEWKDFSDMVQAEGGVYRSAGANGTELVKAHPAVAMRADAWKRVKSMMSEYGLTASSRTKVSAEQPASSDPLDEYLNRRK